MNFFRIGDRVKLKDELIKAITYNNVQPNREWVGKHGTVIEVDSSSYIKVKWDHLDSVNQEHADFIELVNPDNEFEF